MEDLQLIEKIKNENDENSLIELIERHSGIYIDMVNRYLPQHSDGICKQDVIEEKDYSIYNAALSYDDQRNTKFSTHLGNLTKWKCLNIYNKNLKFPQQSIENVYHIKENPKIEENEQLYKEVLKIADSKKDKRIQKIIRMRYGKGKRLTPWKNIAKEVDLSIQGCINIHNKFIKEARTKLC
jgi:DNA-directed RNA polymerase sigma subunit (sigma70/sigma32)